MLNFDENNHPSLIYKYRTQMYGGNRLWDDPEEAKAAGAEIGKVICARFDPTTPAHVLAVATEAINYKAIPEHRRVNLMHGVIDGIAEYIGFGGDVVRQPASEETQSV